MSMDVCGREMPGSLQVYLSTFDILKETPCGWWVQYGFFDRKWVPKKGTRVFAFDSKAKAKESFIARKNRQIRILQARIRRAEQALFMANHYNL